MNINVIKSDNQEFAELISQIKSIAQLEIFQDEQALFLNLQNCDAVLLDLDTDIKRAEKIIKSLKKAAEPKPIIVLCNALEGNKLQKHQNSRSAANIYLTYPIDNEILKMMIEETMNSVTPDDTKTFALDLSKDNNFDIGKPSADDIPVSEEIGLEGDFDLDLGDQQDELLDLSSEGNEAEADVVSSDELDLSISIDESADNEDSITLDDEDSTGGFDLSDLGEDPGDLTSDKPSVIEEPSDNFSLSDDSDESSDGFDLGLSADDDSVKEMLLDETPVGSAGDVGEAEDPDLATIQFSLGGELEEDEDPGFSLPKSAPDINIKLEGLPDQGEGTLAEEVEDDFQTKLREIDDMLKDDTSVSLADDGQADVDDHDEDEYIEKSLINTEAPDPTLLNEESSLDFSSKPLSNYDMSTNLSKDHKDYVENHGGELLRLGETIKSLRLDREQLVKKLHDYEQQENNRNNDLLTMQAKLDERKIENSILKKRYTLRLDDLNLKLELVSDKRAVLEAKNQQFEEEFLKLRKHKNIDVNKVRSKERELEGKLELLRKDAEVQMTNRDHKILELKRRIDTLEFDVESSHMKEKKSVTDQNMLEMKMNKVISTLRVAIGQLEDDSVLDERRKKIKNNLDV